MNRSDESLNYKLACELGYELSKNDYSDMLKYAKLVQNEYLKVSEHSLSPKQIFEQSKTVISSKAPSCSIAAPTFHSEDLWIKQLREYFYTKRNG